MTLTDSRASPEFLINGFFASLLRGLKSTITELILLVHISAGNIELILFYSVNWIPQSTLKCTEINIIIMMVRELK